MGFADCDTKPEQCLCFSLLDFSLADRMNHHLKIGDVDVFSMLGFVWLMIMKN